MKRLATRMQGLTLVEMAIVLLILGVLTRAAIAPLSAVQKHRQYREAVTQLESIRSGLWAHVVSTGVLPCPVTIGGHWLVESGAVCNESLGGIPATVLGLSGSVDSAGALLDPWNRPYRFAVSLQSHEQLGIPEQPDWTTEGEASSVGIAELSADIVVCNHSVSGRCPDKSVRASDLSFVVFTLGSDDSGVGDQSENLDNDQVFTLQEHSVDTVRPFDDMLLWGSAAETMYWMLRAGWLP